MSAVQRYLGGNLSAIWNRQKPQVGQALENWSREVRDLSRAGLGRREAQRRGLGTAQVPKGNGENFLAPGTLRHRARDGLPVNPRPA